jgi:hypothetical protein
MNQDAKKSPSASRPPVDALQYEKLALSAFQLCEQQIGQLNRLAKLASTICRCPNITRDERRGQHALLELLVETAEGYSSDLESDRELYQVIALDAKGVPDCRITAGQAATLLAEAAMENAAGADEDAQPAFIA